MQPTSIRRIGDAPCGLDCAGERRHTEFVVTERMHERCELAKLGRVSACVLARDAAASGREIVGFRQATERLVGVLDTDIVAAPVTTTWSMRRLRNLVVVQTAQASGDGLGELEDVVADAVLTDAAIVVVDLKGVLDLSASALDAIAFTSSTAALRGKELLVVNVCPEVAEVLRTSALSATTYVAPEPPFDPTVC